MKIKTFRSDSVTKALDEVRQELGEGAVILNTKRTKKRRMLGLIPTLTYEITAASEPSTAAEESLLARKQSPPRITKPRETYEPASDAPRAGGVSLALTTRRSNGDRAPQQRSKLTVVEPTLERLRREIEDLRRTIERRESFSSAPFLFPRTDRSSSALSELLEDAPNWKATELVARELHRLASGGLDESLAYSLMRFAASKTTGLEGDRGSLLRTFMNRALSRMISTAPLSFDGHPKRAVFIGPTGVGKTTTIAKLAAIFALGEQRKVKLVTLDTYRIAAAEQLKTYADIIGVPISVVSSIPELQEAIDAASDRECTLVDTAGHSHHRAGDFAELADFLASRDDIRTHLVLSATTKSEDLKEIIRGFESFRPERLVFTKLDETSTFGSIANEAVLSGKPISYLTNGQAVPDDLVVPTPKSVADIVIPVN